MIQTNDVSLSGPQCQTVNRKDALGTPWSLSVEVGDIVKLSGRAREEQPTLEDGLGLVVSRFNALHLHILWAGTDRSKLFSEKYLELINASR